MSAAGSDSDAETVITEGMIEREKESKEKGTLGKVSQMTGSGPFFRLSCRIYRVY